MQAVRTGRKGGLEDFGIDSFERRKAAFFRRWGWKFLPFSQTDPLPHPKLMVPHQTEEVMKLVDLIREGDLVTFVVSDLGMGKTTLCRYLSEVLPLRDPNLLTVFIPAQSIQTPEQMLRVLLSRLEMEAGGDLTEEFEKFYRWHQSYPESKLVVFVDEFPELDVKVAEMIRALADLRNISWVLNGRKDQILAYLQEHVPSLLSRKRYMLEMKPLSLEEVQELILLRMAWAKGGEPAQGEFSPALHPRQPQEDPQTFGRSSQGGFEAGQRGGLLRHREEPFADPSFPDRGEEETEEKGQEEAQEEAQQEEEEGREEEEVLLEVASFYPSPGGVLR
jgi:type II secretory pathway predicted ATPase ExeA